MGMLEKEVETTLSSPARPGGRPEELNPAFLPRTPSPAGSPAPGVTPYAVSVAGSPVLGGSFGAILQGFHGDIPLLPLSLFGPGVGEVPVAQKHLIFLTAVMNGTGGDKRLSLLYMESLVALLAEEDFSSIHLTIHVLIRYDLQSLDQLKYLTESCDRLKSKKVDFKIYFVNQHSHYDRVTKFESIDDATTFTYDEGAKSIKFPSKYLSIIPSPGEFFGPVVVAGGKKVENWAVKSWYSSCEQLLRKLCADVSSTVPITLILTHSHMTTYDELLGFMQLLPAGSRFFLANSPHRWICLPSAIESTFDIRTSRCSMKIAFSEDKPALLTSRLRERFDAANSFCKDFLESYKSKEDDAYERFKVELGKDVPRGIFDTIFESGNVFLGYWNFDKDTKLEFAKKFLGEVSQLPGEDKVIVVTGCKEKDFKRLQNAIKLLNLERDSSCTAADVDIPEGTTYFRYQLLDVGGTVNCTVVAMSFINPKIFDFLLLRSQPLVAMTGEDSVLHAMCYFRKVVCYQCVNGTAEYKGMLLKIMEEVHSELKCAAASAESADAVAKLIQYYNAGLFDASASDMELLKRAAAVVSEKLIAVADTTAGEVLKLCQWLIEASADLTPTEADKKADKEAKARLLIVKERMQFDEFIVAESVKRKAIIASMEHSFSQLTSSRRALLAGDGGSAPPPSAGRRKPGNSGLCLAGGVPGQEEGKSTPSSRPSP